MTKLDVMIIVAFAFGIILGAFCAWWMTTAHYRRRTQRAEMRAMDAEMRAERVELLDEEEETWQNWCQQ